MYIVVKLFNGTQKFYNQVHNSLFFSYKKIQCCFLTFLSLFSTSKISKQIQINNHFNNNMQFLYISYILDCVNKILLLHLSNCLIFTYSYSCSAKSSAQIKSFTKLKQLSNWNTYSVSHVPHVLSLLYLEVRLHSSVSGKRLETGKRTWSCLLQNEGISCYILGIGGQMERNFSVEENERYFDANRSECLHSVRSVH